MSIGMGDCIEKALKKDEKTIKLNFKSSPGGIIFYAPLFM
jgi:hypothetical protein